MENCAERGRFGLIACVRGARDGAWLREFLRRADREVTMDAEGQTRLSTAFDEGCWWMKNDAAYVYLPIGETQRRALVKDFEYTVTASNGNAGYRCELRLPITRE